jgi:hypothetical protein
MFPTWPAKSEGGHKKHDNEPKAPEAGSDLFSNIQDGLNQ